MAKYNIITDGQEVTGTNGVDEITVDAASGAIVSAGAGDDVIKVLKGKSHVVNGESGKDTITISDGTSVTASGGMHQDTITIGRGRWNKAYGDDWNDEILITGGEQHTAMGGSGSDTIRVTGGNKHQLYGGLGTDTIVVEATAGDGILVNGGEFNDTLTIHGGNNHTVVGGDGADTITLDGGNETTVNAGGSEDKILASAGKRHVINGEAGNDEIEVSAGEADTVNGGDGKDRITISGGRWNKAYGEGWNDEIIIAGGEQHTAMGGNGSDTIRVAAGSGHQLYGGQGTDTIIVEATAGDGILVNGGEFNDTLTVHGGNNHTVVGGDGADTITLDGGNGMTVNAGGSEDKITVSAGNDHVINGDAGHDEIEISAGEGVTVNGGDGKDKITVNGGKGIKVNGEGWNDEITVVGGEGHILTGGNGKDTFIFSNETGNNIITDYTERQDAIKLSNGIISATEIPADSAEDVTFTINDSSITLQNGAAKVISIEDSRGSYTVSDTEIVLAINFSGTMDISAYLDTVHTVDGRKAVNAITAFGGSGRDTLYGGAGNDFLYGDANDDWLYGEDGDDHLYSGIGDDHLYGGTGSDVFWFDSGNDIIYDFESGNDTVRLLSSELIDIGVSGNDAILSLSNGGTITLIGMAGQTIDYADADGNSGSVIPVATQQSIMKNFMKSLDNSTTLVESLDTALDEAIGYASNQFFPTWDSLISGFLGEIESFGATSSAEAKMFLESYCGINLDNEDTGSITGADAGGSMIKTAESIVPEWGRIDDIQSPVDEATTINGLTFNWGTANNSLEQAVIDRIYTWWAQSGLDLVEDSYGLSFKQEEATVTEIDVQFVEEDNDTLAYVNHSYYINGPQMGETVQMTLNINMSNFGDLDLGDVSGFAGQTSGYLDRTLAHEFTHAVMEANITGFDQLPLYLKEGSAELVHGIDDFRPNAIADLALASNVDYLSQVLQPNITAGVDTYAGGYMLLRYFAKQAADNYASTLDSSSSGMLDTNSISSAVLSFSDSTISSIANITNDCFHQDNRNSNIIVTGNI